LHWSSNFPVVLSGRFAKLLPRAGRRDPEGSQISAAVGATPPFQSSEERTKSGGGAGEKGGGESTKHVCTKFVHNLIATVHV